MRLTEPRPSGATVTSPSVPVSVARVTAWPLMAKVPDRLMMAGEAAPSTPETAPNTAPPPTESPDAATSARTKEADTKVADAVQKLVATRNSSLVKESAGNVGSVALGTVKGILDTVMLSAQGMKPSVEKGSLADKAAGVVRDQAESMSRAVGGAKTDVDTWTQQKGQEKAQAQTEIDAVKKVLGVEPAQTGGGQKAGPDTKPMGLPDIGDVVARADAAVRQSAAETPVSTVPTQAELEKVVMVAKSREPSKERPGIDAIAHGLKVRKDQDTPPSPVAAPSPAGPEASKKPAEQSAGDRGLRRQAHRRYDETAGGRRGTEDQRRTSRWGNCESESNARKQRERKQTQRGHYLDPSLNREDQAHTEWNVER